MEKTTLDRRAVLSVRLREHERAAIERAAAAERVRLERMGAGCTGRCRTPAAGTAGAGVSQVPADLPARWRRRAALLAAHGARGPARALRRAADDLEAALRAADDEALPLRQAAVESGYSRDRLRHLVAAGQVPNAGRKGAPRIRRADLPRKHGRATSGFDAAAAADRLVRRVDAGRT